MIRTNFICDIPLYFVSDVNNPSLYAINCIFQPLWLDHNLILIVE